MPEHSRKIAARLEDQGHTGALGIVPTVRYGRSVVAGGVIVYG